MTFLFRQKENLMVSEAGKEKGQGALPIIREEIRYYFNRAPFVIPTLRFYDQKTKLFLKLLS